MTKSTTRYSPRTARRHNGLIDLELGVAIDNSLAGVSDTDGNDILVTGVDRLVWLMNAFGKISVEEASRKLKVPEAAVEAWATVLAEQGSAELHMGLRGMHIAKRSRPVTVLDYRERYIKAHRAVRYG